MLPVLAPETTYPHVSAIAVLELVDADRRPTGRAVVDRECTAVKLSGRGSIDNRCGAEGRSGLAGVHG